LLSFNKQRRRRQGRACAGERDENRAGDQDDVAHGKQPHKEMRTFETMTADFLARAGWLSSLGVTHVALESTGVFGGYLPHLHSPISL